jgi:hypothetical protein
MWFDPDVQLSAVREQRTKNPRVDQKLTTQKHAQLLRFESRTVVHGDAA